MKAQVEVSVIIVNWNAGSHLINCLQSLKEHFPKISHEILLVDNASSDGSVQAVREHYPHVQVIENRVNAGFARANNQAMKLARGEYFLLLNPDCRLLPGGVPALVGLMRKHPQVGMCAPQLLKDDGTPWRFYGNLPTVVTELVHRSLLRKINPVRYGVKQLRDKPLEVEWVPGACMLVRRKAIEQAGLFDPQFFLYYEETDLCKRMREKKWKIYLHPGAKVSHVQGISSGAVKTAAVIESWASRYKYYRKHASRQANLVLSPLLFLRVSFNFLFKLCENLLTGFHHPKKRQKLAIYGALLLWHLAGCPESWGLDPASKKEGGTRKITQ